MKGIGSSFETNSKSGEFSLKNFSNEGTRRESIRMQAIIKDSLSRESLRRQSLKRGYSLEVPDTSQVKAGTNRGRNKESFQINLTMKDIMKSPAFQKTKKTPKHIVNESIDIKNKALADKRKALLDLLKQKRSPEIRRELFGEPKKKRSVKPRRTELFKLMAPLQLSPSLLDNVGKRQSNPLALQKRLSTLTMSLPDL